MRIEMRLALRFLVTLLPLLIATKALQCQTPPPGNADWEVLWVNFQPMASDVQNPNHWMHNYNRYTGLAYDKWNDVLYIASPDMCLDITKLVPCPKIHAWDAETGTLATKILNAQSKAPRGQIYVDTSIVHWGLRMEINEAYNIYRIDLDDEGRIYATNVSGPLINPIPHWQPFRLYRWDSFSSNPTLLATDYYRRLIGTSLEVVGKRSLENGVLVDSTRVFVSGGQEVPLWASLLNEIYVYLSDRGHNPALPFRKGLTLKHTEPGSYMAAHGIAATGPLPESQIYMTHNTRPVILNNQTALLNLNVAIDGALTGPAGAIKFWYNDFVNVPYLICADGMNSVPTKDTVNKFTRARVVELTGSPMSNWPPSPTPPLGSRPLSQIWGVNNYISDVDYKLWRNPKNGRIYLQLFVLMSDNGIASFRTRRPVKPVEFETFRAIVLQDKVHLIWQVASELNNFGFEVHRSFNGGGDWEKIGFVHGRGTSSGVHEYEYDDPLSIVHSNVERVQYRLKQVDFDGSYEWTNAINVFISVPGESIVLHQNYPNPVSSSTKISYQLQSPDYVTLKVYNTLGMEVAALVNANKQAGLHFLDFNTAHLPHGTYIYRLISNDRVLERKMVVE
jgi:type IX secretion system substrate protein